jgi:hypothetical protein
MNKLQYEAKMKSRGSICASYEARMCSSDEAEICASYEAGMGLDYKAVTFNSYECRMCQRLLAETLSSCFLD